MKVPRFFKIRSTEKKITGAGIKERWRALQSIPRYVRWVWAIAPGITFWSLVMRLVTAILPSAILFIGKLILDEILFLLAHPPVHGNVFTYAPVWRYILLELGIVLLADLFGKAQSLGDGILGDLVANETSVRLMRHAGALDMEQFEDPTFYDKLERARQQTAARTVLISQMLGQLQDIISLALISGVFIVLYPWLILVLMGSILPSFFSEFYFSRQSYSLARSWTPQRRELDYLRFIGASDETAKEVKIFGLSDFLVDRFKALSTQYFVASRALSVRRSAIGFILSALGSLGYYLAYVFLIFQSIGGLLTIGSLTFLMGSFRQMRGLVESIFSRFNSISQSALYLQDLFDFFELNPKIRSDSSALAFPNPMKIGFEFLAVGFKYPGSEIYILKDLSFKLAPGEKLALVGENGAGKTTLVKLLSRLYDPTDGLILLDGIPLIQYDLKALRGEIGVIFQDFVRYQFTVSDNIAVGQINRREDQEWIRRSAESSMAAPFIENMAGKYTQMLGKRFAEGIELSGGQWQKIALARAYMRKAAVLILDEPTAALDARAEFEAFERFIELSRGKTAILISHRFSTVRYADRILVLDSGKVLEQGTHAELIGKGGRYAELFALQARGYQ